MHIKGRLSKATGHVRTYLRGRGYNFKRYTRDCCSAQKKKKIDTLTCIGRRYGC